MTPKAQLVQAVLNAKKSQKPSAGMSANAKSSAVKQAQSGKDMGDKGKNFSKIAQKAGGGEKGNKVAGAVFWKKVSKR